MCAELNITQAELGRQLDIPASTVGTWVSGKIPKMAEVALTLMLENKEQKEILEAIKKARDFIGRILNPSYKFYKGDQMAEEKETLTGSYNLQIKIPLELKEKLEILAKEAGVSLNQYIMFMFIRETKK